VTQDLLAGEQFDLWGTTAVLRVTDPDALVVARRLLDETAAAVERACSRFRPDSEILALNASAGHGPFLVSDVLLDLIDAALWAADATDGACDPTVLPALLALGYDADIEKIRGVDVPGTPTYVPSPGTGGIGVDRESRTVELAKGCAIDLGAIAKARCTDIAATLIEARLSVGCVVGLGGDLRAAGQAPAGGWAVSVCNDAAAAGASLETVSIAGGGVATSSTSLRRWQRDGVPVHHIVDPRTGRAASAVWSLVTVAAETCVAANAMSTAAVVWGDDALYELPQRGVSARLERPDCTVERVGGWPDPEQAR